MDGDTVKSLELNEFLDIKRKSKRRSSIATTDATKLLNNRKSIDIYYENAEIEFNLQAEWLDKNLKILENYSAMSTELVNRMNNPYDSQVSDVSLLSDEQKEFLSKHSPKPDFSDHLVRKLERISIKSEAVNANLRAKEFEKLKLVESKNHQIKKREPICSLIKRPDIEDPLEFLRNFFKKS